RLEMHDPKDQPAKAQGKCRGNSQPPVRIVVHRRFVDMPDSRGRDHTQAQGRIETGVPALHGLEKPGLPQVEEEHHERVRLVAAGFPLGGFCRLRCRFDVFDFTHGTGLACLGGETTPKKCSEDLWIGRQAGSPRTTKTWALSESWPRDRDENTRACL